MCVFQFTVCHQKRRSTRLVTWRHTRVRAGVLRSIPTVCHSVLISVCCSSMDCHPAARLWSLIPVNTCLGCWCCWAEHPAAELQKWTSAKTDSITARLLQTAVVRRSQIFLPHHRPLPGGTGWPKFNQLEMVTTFTYKPSLVRIDARNFELSW